MQPQTSLSLIGKFAKMLKPLQRGKMPKLIKKKKNGRVLRYTELQSNVLLCFVLNDLQVILGILRQ